MYLHEPRSPLRDHRRKSTVAVVNNVVFILLTPADTIAHAGLNIISQPLLTIELAVKHEDEHKGHDKRHETDLNEDNHRAVIIGLGGRFLMVAVRWGDDGEDSDGRSAAADGVREGVEAEGVLHFV